MREPHQIPPDPTPAPEPVDHCAGCGERLQYGQPVIRLDAHRLLHMACHLSAGDLGVVTGCTGVWVVKAPHGPALEVVDKTGRASFVARQGFTKLAEATVEQLKAAGVAKA